MRKHLKAKTLRVKRISRPEIERMYELFSQYYNNHNLESFTHDLLEKNHVILLYDKQTGVLQGFSTLLRVPLKKSGKKVLGVYSGDTIVNHEYWGSPALGIAFLKYLWKLKIKRLGVPVYWFLITKGYKTYLLMAKNFTTYYPRFDQETPAEYKELMDTFYSYKFKEHYHASSGLIIKEGDACTLKEQVADIKPSHLKEPRIAFFQEKNPQWSVGHELTCIGKMTLWMPLKYVIKKTLQLRIT